MNRPIPFGLQPSQPCTVTVAGPAIHPFRGTKVEEGHTQIEVFTGLSTRDEFAAQALQGLLAEPFSPGTQATAAVINGRGVSHQSEVAMHYACAAYLLADAMLKAREL